MATNGTKLSQLPVATSSRPTDTLAGLRDGINIMIPVSEIKTPTTAHSHVIADIVDYVPINTDQFVQVGTIEW